MPTIKTLILTNIVRIRENGNKLVVLRRQTQYSELINY